MIKGIISLFTSGIILNPMVILGIIFGLILNSNLTLSEVYDVFLNYRIYALGVSFAVIYVIFFKPIYKYKSLELDYKAIALSILKESIRFVFTTALTLSFFMALFF